MIEQRKSTEIVESYQYGERENVPLFYTYIKTNKYLDINEVDSELFKLKNAINTEGIDTDKIFALVHFFTVDKEAPYREVLVEYSSIQSKIKYKQVVKTRAGKAFDTGSWSGITRKVTIEVEESYTSGVIELTVYDFIFSGDIIEIYAYTPMPELIASIDDEALRQMVMTGNQINENEVGGMLQLVETALIDHRFKYRIPYYPGEVSYDVTREAISPMYNWELTTSDDLAFIRLRSDDAKGYYLIEREGGKPVQAKVSFKKKDGVRRSYFIQWEAWQNAIN